jgi:hypothetical protein
VLITFFQGSGVICNQVDVAETGMSSLAKLACCALATNARALTEALEEKKKGSHNDLEPFLGVSWAIGNWLAELSYHGCYGCHAANGGCSKKDRLL